MNLFTRWSFVWNMKNTLGSKVKFFGMPDTGDSTYARAYIDLNFAPNQKEGFRIEVSPRKGGTFADAKDQSILRQAVSISRSTDSSGKIISGIPQKMDRFQSLKWDQSWSDWEIQTFNNALESF